METRYQREMKHNYLIVKPDKQEKDFYEMHMMAENIIEGLLKMHVKYSEQEVLYYYEITSKQPLSRLLETNGMKLKEIKMLITGISAILDRIEGYLLREESIWLDADYIYIKPETYQVYLCLIPGRQENFPKDMERLLQFLLGKIDHKDKEGVVLAYGLFQESQKENYGVKDLLKVICGTEQKEILKRQEEKEAVNRKEEDDEAWKEKQQNGDWEENTGKRNVNVENMGNDYTQKGKWKKSGTIYTVLIFAVVSAFGAGWFILGKQWKEQYGMRIGGLLTAVMVIFLILKGVEKNSEEEEKVDGADQKAKVKNAGREEKGLYRSNGDFWMMELEEEDDEVEIKVQKKEENNDIQRILRPNDTTFLADLGPQKENRKLVSLDKSGEEIRISYYPFIIGKQEGLVDYVMAYDTVSRLHLRIDEEDEGEYKITDLNSTNGTIVKGHMLEANESVGISPGDDLYIADRGFLFI